MLTRALVRAKCKCKTWLKADGIDVRKYIKNLPKRVMAIFYKKKKLVETFEKMSVMYNDEKSEYLFINGAFKYGEEIHSRKCFENYCELQFEDDTFMALVNYDLFFRELYGDYMKLPPENERYNRYMIEEISFGEED